METENTGSEFVQLVTLIRFITRRVIALVGKYESLLSQDTNYDFHFVSSLSVKRLSLRKRFDS